MKSIYLFTHNQMIKWVFILIPFFFACKTSPENKKAGPGKINLEIKIPAKPPSTQSDTLIIHSVSAVFYNPDSIQLEKIRSVNKQPVFESMSHDCFYQMRNARMIIKQYWPQIQIIENSKARYLLFVKKDKSSICIDLNTKGDMCGIFLFDREQDPEMIDMMNIDTALGFYFKR